MNNGRGSEMKIVVAGMSGLIGTELGVRLSKQHELIQLVRTQSDPKKKFPARQLVWDPASPESGSWAREIDGADAVLNLSGESIAGKRWSSAQKKKLISSRLQTTQALVKAIERAGRKPKVFLNASAIGFYGSRKMDLLDEAALAGGGFLADLCKEWERQAKKAESFGVRTVLLRTGIVLSLQGGALAKMILPFRLGLGGPLGSGKQGMSWIHLEDEVNAIVWVLENPNLSGPVNLTSPNPVSMGGFAKTLGKVLHRPAFMPVPAPALKILLGEMSEMLLEGQYVRPQTLLDSGFKFKYPDLEPALSQLLS